jgi:LysM repeat protein
VPAPTNLIAPVTASALVPPVVVTEPPAENPVMPPAAKRTLPKTSPAPSPRPTAVSTQKPRVYVVKAGDTVEKIARMHRTSVEAIKAENKLKNHLLKPGQQLRVSSQKPKITNEV